jgi:hypothetical protein
MHEQSKFKPLLAPMDDRLLGPLCIEIPLGRFAAQDAAAIRTIVDAASKRNHGRCIVETLE